MEHGTGSVLSSTIVTELEQRNIDFDDKASDTDISQTSYAPTLLGWGNVTNPPPPQASLKGVPFEYPYCFYIIKIDGIRTWNKDIFQDLQPYICIAPACTTPNKLYPTRHEWLHHSYVTHPAVMTHDSTTEEGKNFFACLLYKETFDLRKQHDRHLARHLQELSLFILPGVKQDSDLGGDADAASSSDSESVSVALSHDDSRLLEGLPAVPIEHQAAIEGGNYHQGQITEPSLDVRTGPAVEAPTASHAADMAAAPFTIAPPAVRNPTCSTCGQSFTRKSNLERHAKKHSADAKAFRCRVAGCEFKSYRKDKVVYHISRRHGGAGAVVM